MVINDIPMHECKYRSNNYLHLHQSGSAKCITELTRILTTL